MPNRSLTASAVVLLAAAPGCFETQVYPTPTFEADDVRLEMPDNGLRSLGGEGEVMGLADEVASDVNGWVVDMAVDFGRVLNELSQYEPTREDGAWRVYGPFDAEGGEDLSWMVRVEGDETRAAFEIHAGNAGVREREMLTVFAGELEEADEQRAGKITIDFDAIRSLEPLRREFSETDDFGGSIAVSFDRDVDTKAKSVELQFDGFHYADRDEDLEYRDETYLYDRAEDGAGIFHFATWGTFDDEGWSGPERERVTVDMVWDAELAGRARAQVLEVDGEGDLLHGDLVLHECFDPGFQLTWARANEPYAGLNGYDEGDATACRLGEDVFEE